MSLAKDAYYIWTYDNGTNLVKAEDIMTAVNIYLGNTGRSVYTIHAVVKASEYNTR
jgi:hypothetical protein